MENEQSNIFISSEILYMMIFENYCFSDQNIF